MMHLASIAKKLKLPAGLGGQHPSRDWLALVCVSLVLIAASVIWNVTFFTKALRDEAAPVDVANATQESALPALREAFDLRAQEAARYGTEPFVDPSR